ncbi:flagellar hook-associated protein FlgL [uncultured Desulfuromonas sp.]|uniref:flagellar hook-associated protein FlgL n=2 Tax=Desulfuromonas TaxID=890 RepID=UPI002608E6A3|nr:flagellar hook-associated protein FlgL [uncultured Desulfuromonas sp.]
MKVTNASTYRTLLGQLERNGTRLNELRLTAVSGKKLVRPSDDPGAVRSLLAARSDIRGTERYIETMGSALDRLQFTDDQLDRGGDVLIRAKELAIGSLNGALSAEDRQSMAEEVGHLRQELLGVANAEMGGRYLFGGFRDDAPPFGDAPPHAYGGDGGALNLEIGPGEQVRVNAPGDELFKNGVDLFALLEGFEADLRADDTAGIQGRLGDLDAGMEQLRSERSRLGSTAARIEEARGHMEGVKVDMQMVLSRIEDADIVETISSLTQQEAAYEAALSVTSKISQLSILKYL